MGRGTYLGGSTVVGPRSGWFSFDSPRRGGKRKAQGASSKPQASAKSNRKRSKPKKVVDPEQLRKLYLRQVIGAILRNSHMPNIPRRAKPWLPAAIDQAGGIKAWAESQAEFANVLDQQRAKLKKRNPLPEILLARANAGRKGTIAAKKLSGVPEIERLFQERQRFEEALREAREIVETCEARLARIERQIDLLKR